MIPAIGSTWLQHGMGGLLRVVAVGPVQAVTRERIDVFCDLVGEIDGESFGAVAIPLERWTAPRMREVFGVPVKPSDPEIEARLRAHIETFASAWRAALGVTS